ncbi:LCP family protein [Brevibacillus daliensis]|uniref:LCP family protein n=1 Tax=Brevibacillus daliensis TaxID=2892995 RepID=UPI001E60CD52|nr:LCP family protein [Brevibacillus daliensis]
MKKRIKKKWILWLCLIPVILFLFSAAGFTYYLYQKAVAAENNMFQELNRGENSVVRDDEKDNIQDSFSVLFIGVDQSENRKDQYGKAVRSDALMLATFNKQKQTIKLVSIPRDSYVYIPVEGKKDKITHAHAFGGVDGTVETVEGLLDIPIDYYVKLDFEGFVSLIDVLDGIEVDVPITFKEQDSNDRPGAIRLEKGLQTLNGEEALALARTRKIDSDAERGKRQQLIMEAILDKTLSFSTITKSGAILDAMGDHIKTNLTRTEMYDLLQFGKNHSQLQIEKMQLAGSDIHINGIYYYQLDDGQLDEIIKTLQQHLGYQPDKRVS